MALLTVQPVTTTGLETTYVAAAGGGDTVRPGDGVFLHVKNGGGGDITVTLVQKAQCSFGGASPTHDRVVTVTAGEDRMIPTGPEGRFADSSTGLASIAYSGVTTVTVAAVRS